MGRFKNKAFFFALGAVALLLASLQTAFAQRYPVQGVLSVAAPYPAYLSDYANGNIEKVVLNLTLTDVNLSNKRVKLKLFIQSQNTVIAQSREEIINEPNITLDGGAPQRLTSTELAPYFALENLQGMTPDAYSRTLPEGVYDFGFEVYDYFTGNALSGRIHQLFWLLLNDPPLLNMPLNKENIPEVNPNNPQIVFQWMPRSTQATHAEYIFTLCELWDDEGNPYPQFLAGVPKYQTTVTHTTLIYGLAEPPLLAGRTYAWRVQAQAKAGFENIGLYRQEGYSQIFTFKYGGQCPLAENMTLEAKSYDRIYATWEPPAANRLSLITPSYTIAIRKYTEEQRWQWFEFPTANAYYNLVSLEGNTEYEIKIGNNCPSGASKLISYAPPQRITTLPPGSVAGIDCGKEPVIDLSNRTLIDALSENDIVMASDFQVVLMSVSGDKNGWSGEAWTKIKWLGDFRIKLKYKDIKVNTDRRLIGGFFETTYDPSGKNMLDADETIKKLEDLLNEIKNIVDRAMNSNNPVKFKATIDSLKHSTAGKLANTDNETKELINKKFDEMKDAANNTPLNTPSNKEAVAKKVDEIDRIAKTSLKERDTKGIAKKIKKKKCYYEIEKNKFYNGDTIFLPKPNKKYAVKGYKDASKPVDSKSVWRGFGTKKDSATYLFAPVTVSKNMNGSLLSTIFMRDSIYRITKKDKTIDSLIIYL